VLALRLCYSSLRPLRCVLLVEPAPADVVLLPDIEDPLPVEP